MFAFGANLEDSNSVQQTYANFFFITGFHGFHVFGAIINIIIFLMARMGVDAAATEMVEKTGLYWHFVDLVWVFAFTFFYLI